MKAGTHQPMQVCKMLSTPVQTPGQQKDLMLALQRAWAGLEEQPLLGCRLQVTGKPRGPSTRGVKGREGLVGQRQAGSLY